MLGIRIAVLLNFKSEDEVNIQWFPGHMTKALREMEKQIGISDAVIYVLDARAPFSCLNPKFSEIVGGKGVVFVLNKCDLADPVQTARFKQYFLDTGYECVELNSTMTNSSKLVVESVRNLAQRKLKRYEKKGVNITLRAMVIGVPNCGKSTLINNLCGKYKAVTGDKPSVTKVSKWVKVAPGLEVLDTPGTLWPAFEDERVAVNLACINSIKDDVVDKSELALELIAFLLQHYKDEFLKRYDLEFDPDKRAVEYLENVCERRKFLMRGGEVDWERGAAAVLDDFRKGRIGRITLDVFPNEKHA